MNKQFLFIRSVENFLLVTRHSLKEARDATRIHGDDEIADFLNTSEVGSDYAVHDRLRIVRVK